MQADVFSGSYPPEDVRFLLKVVEQEILSVEEKEKLIQSGARHYSELIGPEHAPSERYMQAFEAAVRDNGDRLARDVLTLSHHIHTQHPRPLCLVSLARAGTPIGVLLRRTLRDYFGRQDVHHVSVSIIAGRGIDTQALDWVRRHLEVRDEDLVFVDGWTGKGVISRELRSAVERYNQERGASLSPQMHVIADLCGHTHAASTTDDYLIPSCLLGATISGLISRSILNRDVIGAGDFHGCLYYDQLSSVDCSRRFVDGLSERIAQAWESFEPRSLPVRDLAAEKAVAAAAVERWRVAEGLSTVKYVKPGIAEATRVLLRRVPKQLVLRSLDNPQVQATILLAQEKEVPIVVDPNLPWSALSTIREKGS